jgi:hypothetical protein
METYKSLLLNKPTEFTNIVSADDLPYRTGIFVDCK